MIRSASLVALVALLVAAPAARAQSAPALSPITLRIDAVSLTPVGPATGALSAGARPVSVGATEAVELSRESAALRRRARFSNSQTLMIVGGATFLAGAIIGDNAGTVVMVGGAAVGLYGLYLYLQQN